MERRLTEFIFPSPVAATLDADMAKYWLGKSLGLDGKAKIGKEHARTITWQVGNTGRPDRKQVVMQTIQEMEFDCRTEEAIQLDDSRVEDWLARVLTWETRTENQFGEEVYRQVTRGDFVLLKWSYPAKDADKPRTTVTARFVYKGGNGVPVTDLPYSEDRTA